jgi:hypothetical protein
MSMDNAKKNRLESAGYRIGDAEDFLDDIDKSSKSDEEKSTPQVSSFRGFLKDMPTDEDVREDHGIRRRARQELIDELIDWVVRKHEHHTDDPEIGGPCPEGEPYVNSMELEKHLRELRDVS